MTRSLQRYLKTSDTLSHLQEHLARLSSLQHVLESALAPPLSNGCRVANLKPGELVISTQSSAVAVRLKQLVPSLMAHFAQAGYPLNTIRIKMSPAGNTLFPASPPPVTERHISNTARAQLTQFAAQLPPDAPLRQALEHLVRHSK